MLLFLWIACKIILLLIEFIYIYFGFKYLHPFLLNLIFNSVNSPSILITHNSIEEATTFLNLPVWSRNYKACSSPKSEINCNQVLEAYKTIKEWSDIGANRPSYAAVHIAPKAGIGNGFFHIISGLILAISLNRSAQILKEIDGIQYNPLLNRSQELKCKSFGHWPIKNQEYWQRNTYQTLKDAQVHITSTFCFPYFILTEPGFSKFVYEHFGVHYVYFILNFANLFSEKVSEYVNSLFKSVPASVKVIGVHIRTHKNQVRHYIYTREKVEKVILPFLNGLLEEKNYVAIATDWMVYIDLFKEKFGERLLMADVMRKPDGDKLGASIDIRLLMGCNKMIGTYRSTFSSIAGMMAMHRVFYVAVEYPNVFQFSSSQVGITSGIFEDEADFNYFVNTRVRLYSPLEPALRTFFRNTVY